jgi:hypothetical protein
MSTRTLNEEMDYSAGPDGSVRKCRTFRVEVGVWWFVINGHKFVVMSSVLVETQVSDRPVAPLHEKAAKLENSDK